MKQQLKEKNTVNNNNDFHYKILVVDDDHGILDAIALILEDEGYLVNTVSNGNTTIKKVMTFKPDLILLDVLLSGTDGRDICIKLKNDEQTKQIPIIMISAHPSAKETLKKYGADAFLSKPFGAKDLLRIIKKHLQ